MCDNPLYALFVIRLERAVDYTRKKANLHFAKLWWINKETKDNFKSKKKVGIQFLRTFI